MIKNNKISLKIIIKNNDLKIIFNIYYLNSFKINFNILII